MGGGTMAAGRLAVSDLVKLFKKANAKSIGFKMITHPEACQQLLDKLDLPSKYPNASSNLEILDIYPNFGLFSAMLNHQLKPKSHLLIENNPHYVKEWKERLNILETTGNAENFKLIPQSGYKWGTYSDLEKNKILNPKTISRDKVHDELLIVANLTTSLSESLMAQWMACGLYQNWIQKYGRVRMVFLIPEVTAVRFWSGESFKKRNKTAIKREWFNDSRLIGVSEAVVGATGETYDPNCLILDQPVVIPSKAIHPRYDIAMVELVPKTPEILDFSLLDYMLQELMYRPTATTREGFGAIAPGVKDDLIPKIPSETLDKTVRSLSIDDLRVLLDAYDKWPFKPDVEDRVSVYVEEEL